MKNSPPALKRLASFFSFALAEGFEVRAALEVADHGWSISSHLLLALQLRGTRDVDSARSCQCHSDILRVPG
jgi:hypothetical protein